MNSIKKFLLVMALCILLTACGSDNQPAANIPSDKPVAIIENYEEVANNITIQRANGTSGGSEALLYPNDEITGDLDSVQIKCAPYADFQNKNGAYIISYAPPSGIGAIAHNAIDSASSFWNNVESVTAAASRGSDSDLNLNPKPGFDVTLLQNQPVTFAWDGLAENFYITDETGNKIFETPVKGKSSVEINPSDIKLTDGQKYSWGLDENSSAYKFTILDAQTSKEISAKLDEIDAENIPADERTLKKSAYIQLISDIYPDKVDLYWLSAQWLTQFSPTDAKLKETQGVLLRKCVRHLDEEM